MAAVRPDLAAEFHPTKNGFTAFDVLPSTNKRVWWVCSMCSSEWSTTGSVRASGSGCPTCSSGGYDQTKPGVLYVLAGGENYGKIGISNLSALEKRMTYHRCNKIFAEPILLIHFKEGGGALRVETAVKRFLRKNYNISHYFAGHTEAFPAGHEDEVIEIVWDEVGKLQAADTGESNASS
jgi:hypothetical protein